LTHSPRLRRLRAILGLLVLAVLGALLLLLLRPRPVAPPAPVKDQVHAVEEEDASQVSIRFDFTRTLAGAVRYRVEADRVLGRRGTVYELDRPRIEAHDDDDGVTRVQGKEGVLDTETDSGRITGEARARTPSGIEVQAAALVYDGEGASLVSEGEARFRKERVHGRADRLELDPGSHVLRLLGAVQVNGEPEDGAPAWTLRSDRALYHTSTGTVETGAFVLDGAHGHLRGDRLELEMDPEGGRVRTGTAVGNASLVERTGGGRMEGVRIRFDPGPTGATTAARVVASGEAALQPGATGETRVREIRAQRIDVRRRDGTPEALRDLDAAGAVQVRLASRENPAAEEGLLLSDRLQARLAPDGRVAGGTAAGNVRYRGAEGRATGERAVLEGERLRLTGSSARPPWLISPERRVAARTLVVEQTAGLFLAEGDVRTTSLRDPSGIFDAGEGPVYGAADRLRGSRPQDEVVYDGAVRLWQGDNMLQADQVRIHPDAGLLRARGRVLSRSRAAAGPEGRPQMLSGRSEALDYDDSTGVATYSGEASLDMEPDRVEADRIVVTLAAGRRVRRVVADGGVRLRFQEHRGEGDHLDYRPEEGTAVLEASERLAMAQDLANQRVVRGSSLTFDLLDGRIQLRSAPGGRTWITLGDEEEAPAEPEDSERDGAESLGPAAGR
jgi:lipopolysaccharide export system protein LptA